MSKIGGPNQIFANALAGDFNGDRRSDLLCYSTQTPGKADRIGQLAFSTGSGWNISPIPNGQLLDLVLGTEIPA